MEDDQARPHAERTREGNFTRKDEFLVATERPR